jgi:hypothetical protein
MKLPSTFAFVVSFLTAAAAKAEGGFTIEKTAGGGAIVKHEGKVFAEYVIDQANKPYLAPVFGPTQKQMTRNYPMKTVEGEQHDHPHHRGIVFGHEGLGGFETWSERTTYEEANAKKAGSGDARLAKLGSIRHREYKELKADAAGATIFTLNDYLDPSGKKGLTEERRLTFRAADDTRVIDFDIDLIASEGDVHVEDKKDAGLSIRVPTTMAVDSKGGGRIITSEGKTDAAAWATHAKWCDYAGPVEGEQLGVAILNHPSSFRYPTGWHVRTYGLFTANPFASQQFDKKAPDAAFTIKAGERMKLRHRFIFHTGDDKSAKIAEAWEAYAKETK